MYRNPDASNPTIDQLLADLDELIDYLRKRFDRRAIILVQGFRRTPTDTIARSRVLLLGDHADERLDLMLHDSLGCIVKFEGVGRHNSCSAR